MPAMKKDSLTELLSLGTPVLLCREKAVAELTHPGNSAGSPEEKGIIQVQY